MPELIQFSCPACGAMLRVPLAAAGFQGPCPRCSVEIAGPDPALGLGARLAPPAAAPSRPFAVNPARANDPFNPFRMPARPETPAPAPPAPAVVPPAPAATAPPAPQAVEPPYPEPIAHAPEEPALIESPEPIAFQAPQPIASPAPAPVAPVTPEPFTAPVTPEPVAAPEPAAPFVEAAAPEPRAATPVDETPPFYKFTAAPLPPDTPPSVAPAPTTPSAPQAAHPEPPPPAQTANPSRAVLILSCALATLVGLMGGYFIGLFGPRPEFAAEKQIVGTAPDPVSQATTSTAGPPDAVPEPPEQEPQAEPGQPEENPEPAVDPEPPVNPEPLVDPDQPVDPEPPGDPEQPGADPPIEEEPPPADDEPPPLKIIPAPEAALKAFLSAPDWKSRALHVLHPEETTAKMEAYHADAADGPTAYTSLRVDASHGDGEKDARLLSYLVVTESNPDGFPVAIVETPEGWKVDWETFVEFRDDHFGRFSAGQGGDTGAFHVLVRNTHYFGQPFPGIEKLTAFRLDPPLPNRNQYAFVPTGSELHKILAGSTEWGRPCAPVLQLVRKQHGDSKSHIEIESILAPNWRPVE